MEDLNNVKNAIEQKYKRICTGLKEDGHVYMGRLDALFPQTVLDAENYAKACDILQETEQSIQLTFYNHQNWITSERDDGIRKIEASQRETERELKKAQKIKGGLFASKSKKEEKERQRDNKTAEIIEAQNCQVSQIQQRTQQAMESWVGKLHLELNRILVTARAELDSCCEKSNRNITYRDQLIANLLTQSKVYHVLQTQYKIDEYISAVHLTEMWEKSDGKLRSFLKKNRYLFLLQEPAVWDVLLPEEYQEFSLSIAEAFCSATHENGYNKGYADGYEIGHNKGYDEGYDEGYAAGESDGYGSGYNSGYAAGETTGYSSGYAAGESDGYDDGYRAGQF